MNGAARTEDTYELRARLDEAERTLSAIRNGEVDALVVKGERGDQIFTLEGADKPYRKFFEEMREGAATLTPEGLILFTNSSIADSLKIPQKELNGKNLLDLVEPGIRDELRHRLDGAKRDPFRLEVRFVASDGSLIPMMVALNGMKDSGQEIVCLTATDLSELKRIEVELKRSRDMFEARVEERTRELQASKAMMETILMQMPAGIAVVGRDGSLVMVNDEMGKILSDLSPRSRLEPVPEEGRLPISKDQLEAVVNRVVGSVLEADLDNRFELEYDRSNGTRGHLSIRSTPVRNDDGSVEAGVRLILDVSETFEMQKERQELMNRLRRSNEELQQFVSVASHDLKEPLRMVSNYVGLIRKRYQGRLDPDADEFIAYAIDGAKRMQDLIDDLLRYSRVDTKAEPFRVVDLNEVMESVTRDLEDPIKSAGATIVHGELPEVSGDRSQMIQLMENLVSNAIKFRGSAKPVVEISVIRKDSLHQFTVKDNGIGIPEGCNERIFQMFQRAHKGMDYDGTGIGLAICKKIVERHGGRIWVESNGGNGSSFRFTIPDGK